MWTTGWPAASRAATLASWLASAVSVQPHVGKDAVVAVDLGRADGLAVDGRNSLPQLAGGFGDQLLQPRAQVVDLRRSEDGDLVASGVGRRAQQQAKLHGGIVRYRPASPRPRPWPPRPAACPRSGRPPSPPPRRSSRAPSSGRRSADRRRRCGGSRRPWPPAPSSSRGR